MSIVDNLGGIVPGAPELFSAPQVTSQPLFLPGTVEAEIEAFCAERGWSWHLVRVVAERKIALLMREPEPLLGETVPALCQMDAARWIGGVSHDPHCAHIGDSMMPCTCGKDLDIVGCPPCRVDRETRELLEVQE